MFDEYFVIILEYLTHNLLPSKLCCLSQCFSTKGNEPLNKGWHNSNLIKCLCTKKNFLFKCLN